MTTEPAPHRPEDPAMPSQAALREPDPSTLPGPDPLRNRIRHISATGAAQSRVAFRLRGRSLLVFAFTPELPIAGWLSELDRWLRQSQGFFAGRPVVLDLSGVKLTKYDFAGLIAEFEARDIRKTYTFAELGFKDHRKGDLPDTRWPILRLFARQDDQAFWDYVSRKRDREPIAG